VYVMSIYSELTTTYVLYLLAVDLHVYRVLVVTLWRLLGSILSRSPVQFNSSYR